MINLKINIDPEGAFKRALTELEQSQIPFATSKAINAVAYQIRQEWMQKAPKVFDNPVALTRKAALYTKGSKANPAATIFIRDEAFKGISPAKYLQAQVFGGPRAQKRHEKAIGYISAKFIGHKNIFPNAGAIFTAPSKGARRDVHGDIPGGQYTKILSQLGLSSDEYQNQTNASREKGKKKLLAVGTKPEQYVALPRAGKRKGGIYLRSQYTVGSGKPARLRMILNLIKRPKYKKRYDILKLAQTLFDRRISAIFKKEVEAAAQSTFNKKFGL